MVVIPILFLQEMDLRTTVLIDLPLLYVMYTEIYISTDNSSLVKFSDDTLCVDCVAGA